MKIFISQSGERSRALAEQLAVCVRRIVPGADPWVSSTNIDKGARSLDEIRNALAGAVAGIVCLTSDNLTAPWVLFEGGALSGKLSDRLWTVLLDVEHQQVEPPLGQFQHTRVEQEDLRRMFASMNSAADKPHQPDDLNALFDALWPTIGQRIDAIRAMPPTAKVVKRSDAEIIAELLALSRGNAQRAWMQEKTLKMLHQIYRAVFGMPAPTLAELRGLAESDSWVGADEAAMPASIRALVEQMVVSRDKSPGEGGA